MPKYSAYLPIAASAKFTVEVGDGATPEEIREALLSRGESGASLCWQCGDNLEVDDTNLLTDDIEEEFAYFQE